MFLPVYGQWTRSAMLCIGLIVPKYSPTHLCLPPVSALPLVATVVKRRGVTYINPGPLFYPMGIGQAMDFRWCVAFIAGLPIFPHDIGQIDCHLGLTQNSFNSLQQHCQQILTHGGNMYVWAWNTCVKCAVKTQTPEQVGTCGLFSIAIIVTTCPPCSECPPPQVQPLTQWATPGEGHDITGLVDDWSMVVDTTSGVQTLINYRYVCVYLAPGFDMCPHLRVCMYGGFISW